MKIFLRRPHEGSSGYVALILFLLVYAATLALVIAPHPIKTALEAPWAWPFTQPQ